MRKVVIAGTVNEYREYEKLIKDLVLNENTCVEGVYICPRDEVFEIEGVRNLSDEEFVMSKSEYVFCYSDMLFPLVSQIFASGKPEAKKLIRGCVKNIPFFSWDNYLKLYDSEISIIAAHCFGGFIYHSLGIPRRTPFINLFMSTDDYLKMVMNLKEYMTYDIEYVRDEWEMSLKRNYPVMRLKDIEIHFNHYVDARSATEFWNGHRERINYDNIFCECMLENEQQIEKFLSLPYKKIAFTNLDYDNKEILDNRFMNAVLQGRSGQVYQVANTFANLHTAPLVDVLKMLLGELTEN